MASEAEQVPVAGGLHGDIDVDRERRQNALGRESLGPRRRRAEEGIDEPDHAGVAGESSEDADLAQRLAGRLWRRQHVSDALEGELLARAPVDGEADRGEGAAAEEADEVVAVADLFYF